MQRLNKGVLRALQPWIVKVSKVWVRAGRDVMSVLNKCNSCLCVCSGFACAFGSTLFS